MNLQDRVIEKERAREFPNFMRILALGPHVLRNPWRAPGWPLTKEFKGGWAAAIRCSKLAATENSFTSGREAAELAIGIQVC